MDRSARSPNPANSVPPTAILSAGVAPVFRDSEGVVRVLLLRVFSYWDFPKGMVEKGEDPFAAAVRELREETGIQKVEFKWGKDFLETEPYSRGKTARYYIGEVFSAHVELLVNPMIGKAEHDEYRWCTVDEAARLVVPRVNRILNWVMETIQEK